MSKTHQLGVRELSMQVYEITRLRAAKDPDFMMCEIADIVIARFDTSRATAFRYIRAAVDVLCIDYGNTPPRIAKHIERTIDGLAEARGSGWPNGKPGGRN